jgi:hypothetical protein
VREFVNRPMHPGRKVLANGERTPQLADPAMVK